MVLDMDQILAMCGQNCQLLDTGRAARVVHGGSPAIILLVWVSIVVQQQIHYDGMTSLAG